jgi:hypothetical protein
MRVGYSRDQVQAEYSERDKIRWWAFRDAGNSPYTIRSTGVGNFLRVTRADSADEAGLLLDEVRAQFLIDVLQDYIDKGKLAYHEPNSRTR